MSESVKTDKYAPLPLVIRRHPADGHYEVFLGETDLTWALAADGGVRVEFDDSYIGRVGGPVEPTVTLKFVPDGLTLDLEADLTAYLREKIARENTSAVRA